MRWDILGVSITTAISVFLQFLAMARLGLQATTLRWRDLARVHVEATINAVIVGGVAWAVATALRAAHQSLPVVAAGTTIGGTLVFFVLARAGMRRGRGEWPWLRESLAGFLRKTKPAARAPADPVVADQQLATAEPDGPRDAVPRDVG
jgi:hypothetical protein